ncbi:unnamed protein product [Closterium sp. Naga37s-1]|nr:unnamed protein product [Closterium sp. Naga37s-1]
MASAKSAGGENAGGAASENLPGLKAGKGAGGGGSQSGSGTGGTGGAHGGGGVGGTGAGGGGGGLGGSGTGTGGFSSGGAGIGGGIGGSSSNTGGGMGGGSIGSISPMPGGGNINSISNSSMSGGGKMANGLGGAGGGSGGGGGSGASGAGAGAGGGGGSSSQSLGAQPSMLSNGAAPGGSFEAERLRTYRQWFHELDAQRSELISSGTKGPVFGGAGDAGHQARRAVLPLPFLIHSNRSQPLCPPPPRLLECEIRCLEELVMLGTKLGALCCSPIGGDATRLSAPAATAIPGKPRLGGGVDSWPSDDPLSPVDGLDLSLVTDMLLLSATSPWTVYVADRTNWRLCYVSPSVRATLGWRQAELVGEHAFAACHADDLPRIQRMIDDRRLTEDRRLLDDRRSPPLSLTPPTASAASRLFRSGSAGSPRGVGVGDSLGSSPGGSAGGQCVFYRRLRRNRSYATVQATGRALGAR